MGKKQDELIVGVIAVLAITLIVLFNGNVTGYGVEDIPVEDRGDPTINQCEDTDGLDETVKGTASSYIPGKGIIAQTDTCWGETAVREFFCLRVGAYNRLYVGFIECDTFCEDGVCI